MNPKMGHDRTNPRLIFITRWGILQKYHPAKRLGTLHMLVIEEVFEEILKII